VILHVTSIRFKRSSGSPLEAGLLVENRNYERTLIDLLGKPVPHSIWYFVEDHEIDIAWEPAPFQERVAK
jgi:hypothetical protein